VSELKNREVMKRVTLLEGRAISMGRNLPFHPIIHLLKQWAKIREDDTEAKAFEKLETAIRDVCPEDFYEVLPFVATLMGMKLSGRHAERVKGIEGEALEKLILKNVRDLLIKATDLTPLVIVAEDLHWADTSSLELMESLFRLVETRRIVFVNVFRPDHKETGDRIVETSKEEFPEHSIEISLQPLDGRLSEALINNMVKMRGHRHPVIDQIIQRADGNPFFIEEVVRSFLDEGAVVIKDGTFELTGKIDAMVIPHTINDVLMARIDRLEEKTRELIKVASVIGRNFFYRILAEVAKTIEDMDKRLEYLKGIQLIRERRRMEELEYLFKHALAQGATYESILLQKRKELHAKVANSIEKIFKERLHEFYGMLAFHYSMGENEDKAEKYLIKAGEASLKSSASSEAFRYYQDALDLYLKKHGDAVDAEKVSMLENNIAISFFNKGRYAEAVEYFNKSLAHSTVSLPKNSIYALLRSFLSSLHFLVSFCIPLTKFKKIPSDEDMKLISSVVKKIKAHSHLYPKSHFLERIHCANWLLKFDLSKIKGGVGFIGLASLLLIEGNLLGIARRMLETSRIYTPKDDCISILSNELAALMYQLYVGDWNKISDYDDNLIEQNLSIGEVLLTCMYVYFHGFLSIENGLCSNAQEKIDRLLYIFDVYENEIAKSMKYALNTRLLIKNRKLSEFFRESEEGLTFRMKIGAKWLIVEDYSVKAQAQVLSNDMSGAEDSLKLIREQLSGNKDVQPAMQIHLLISDFAFLVSKCEKSKRNGTPSEFSMYRRTVIKPRRSLIKHCRKYVSDRTEAYRLIGTYHWLVGKQNEAVTWWNKSIKEGEHLGARLELSRAYFEVGRRISEADSKFNALNGIKADEYLGKARSMFKDMDLQWDLDQLDRISLYG